MLCCGPHFEKLGSSLQQCRQHQSVIALFYAEPQLGYSEYFPPPSHFRQFLAISRIFKAIQSNSRQWQVISRLFQAIPSNSSPFLCMSASWDQFQFSHHWPWLCASEAFCLEGCFPLEPKAFCKLTFQNLGNFANFQVSLIFQRNLPVLLTPNNYCFQDQVIPPSNRLWVFN